MPEQPYHHGNLRAALLTQAETTLREQGIEQLSLRDLARQVGVSHAAPRRHFTDRQALLDALAAVGFTRLNDLIDAAITAAGSDYEGQLRAGAGAYVRFATDDAALHELMFAVKGTEPAADLRHASERFFTTIGDLIARGQQAGRFRPGDPEHLRLLLAAVLQGMAALAASGRLRAEQVDALIPDAVALFTHHQQYGTGQATDG